MKKFIQKLILNRQIFPCFFGSALKDFGVDELLEQMNLYMQAKEYGEEFAARVFKIGRDHQNNRLTYMKITGGKLKVKSVVNINGRNEKINEIKKNKKNKKN